MKFKAVFLTLMMMSPALFAVSTMDLYKAPLDALNSFSIQHQLQFRSLSQQPINTLQELSQTQQTNKTTTRYQQFYKGIPLVGAQVTVAVNVNQGLNSGNQVVVNGHLSDDLQYNTRPSLNSQEAIDLAKKAYLDASLLTTTEEIAELQIRVDTDNRLQLVYLVSFRGMAVDSKPVWPFFIVDAQTGAIINQWDNIKSYSDSGPGGNEKIHEYWYGQDGLPALEVAQKGNYCVMENSLVKLVQVDGLWDWNNDRILAYQYLCGKNKEEYINGAYSPANDAYYFGNVLVTMYQDWYGLHALQTPYGQPMQLVMRVHFGQNYDNAFWDGQSLSFGDGSDFYPLVSLDIAGHEVTHGFTQQHSGLEYHDQSGALNESMSDIAGQASRAYLLEKMPELYNRAYKTPNEITWGIGETVVRDSFGKALRYMDFPSSDGSSADCLDKALAQSKGAYCAISYKELIAFANTHIYNPQERQSFIVHTASGIFNKAFYLLAKDFGIRRAFHAMILANTQYWT
ncbi:MAG: M4 family metallopeptidase, partial [Legionellales bacterium]